MKFMTLTSYGADAPFVEAELPRPLATPGHVVLRVKATSVNTIDTMIKGAGKDLPLSPDLPAVLGMDFAGIIEELGEGVTGFAVGDEVYGCAGGLADLQGALAEFMRADARLIAHKPKSLSMREAAALPLVGITAWEGHHRLGRASPGGRRGRAEGAGPRRRRRRGSSGDPTGPASGGRGFFDRYRG
ncbi:MULTISPECIES: alcohol dehydrogenase catalytic domain-containing protein [Sulfitobacter]|uniref:Alcohol dehydrogenase catalytic domain-containing protein n=1 Tax=Sulfitobacter profundi TaxID=2679961 RepID=A0ABW1YUV0_9RHOB|nr:MULTISPECIES: alcohol dehydrogenase catalytic domain-containing protein [Sulfitobacter]